MKLRKPKPLSCCGKSKPSFALKIQFSLQHLC